MATPGRRLPVGGALRDQHPTVLRCAGGYVRHFPRSDRPSGPVLVDSWRTAVPDVEQPSTQPGFAAELGAFLWRKEHGARPSGRLARWWARHSGGDPIAEPSELAVRALPGN